jgi:hypothetical protein
MLGKWVADFYVPNSEDLTLRGVASPGMEREGFKTGSKSDLEKMRMGVCWERKRR